MITSFRDPHSSAPPRLALGHSLWALQQLPHPPEHYVAQLREHGFESIEVGLRPAGIADARRFQREYGLKVIGQGWAQSLAEARTYLEAAAELEAWGVNLHLGHAYLTPAEAAQLATDCQQAALALGLFMTVETHRGRMTQDLCRTAEWARLAPTLCFNLDVSHFIVGGEGWGGSEEHFWRHLMPILERTAMIHARVGDTECVQSDIGENGQAECAGRFTEIWSRAMKAWLARAGAGEVFVFAPELGPPPYAQTDLSGGQLSDRWRQSLVMAELGRRVWAGVAG